jgi:hypothetical protein
MDSCFYLVCRWRSNVAMKTSEIETLAREWNEAASYAELHPHDDKAWLKANELYKCWKKAANENRLAT